MFSEKKIMKLTDIRGLKYPDEYIIKFFFKEGLNRMQGNVIEFGCGNGNNLMLFHQFGWNVTGIDIDKSKLDDALNNFGMTSIDANYKFIQHDISKWLVAPLEEKFDAVLLPNIIYYIPRQSVIVLLSQVAALVKNGAYIFLRVRGIKDYRYGRGEMVERNGFILNIKETGEFGFLNVFYYEYELVNLLRGKLGLEESSLQLFSVDNLNLQNGVPVHNSDIVIWGRCQTQ
jgi:SAM-dependent methyltransferase